LIPDLPPSLPRCSHGVDRREPRENLV
jgi:hypothetical protein